MRWQKKARFGVAIFGIAFAIVVYAAIGERQATTPEARPSRFDPRAVLESIGSKVQQLRLAKQDYVVEADRQLTYEDGSTKLVGVRIRIPDREGRDVTISGREAQSTGSDQKELELTGEVKLSCGDGIGMIYDNNNSILSLTEMAHVMMRGEDDVVTMEFTSGAATLARHDHLELIG